MLVFILILYVVLDISDSPELPCFDDVSDDNIIQDDAEVASITSDTDSNSISGSYSSLLYNSTHKYIKIMTIIIVVIQKMIQISKYGMKVIIIQMQNLMVKKIWHQVSLLLRIILLNMNRLIILYFGLLGFYSFFRPSFMFQIQLLTF